MEHTLHPWKKQMFKVTKIADEPALSKDGFWHKPTFGVSIDELKNKRATKISRKKSR